jgi:hypothetical protein
MASIKVRAPVAKSPAAKILGRFVRWAEPVAS